MHFLALFLNHCRHLLFGLVVLVTAVSLHEVFHCEIATAHANHNCFLVFVQFDEDPLAVVSVDTLRLTFKLHLAAQLQRSFVDVVCEGLVDGVFLNWLVSKKFIFVAHHFDSHVKSVNFPISCLEVLQQLQAIVLGFLTLILYFTKVAAALPKFTLQGRGAVLKLLESFVGSSQLRLRVFLSAKESLKLGLSLGRKNIILGESFDDLVFLCDFFLASC